MDLESKLIPEMKWVENLWWNQTFHPALEKGYDTTFSQLKMDW